MENMDSTVGEEQKMNNGLIYDILVKIFLCLNVVDVAVASLVCKSWNNACRDPSLWNKIDLSRISSYCFNAPFNKVGAYRYSSLEMTQFLKHVLDLSNGNTTCIIFNFYVYLTNEQFIMVAERTPNLKRLVLPQTGDFSRAGVDTVLSLWRGLESITLTSAVSSYYMILAIGKHCKNITELKFSEGNFEEKHAMALTKYTPKLKILSIRNLPTSLKALLCVLNFFEDLEKVNICHSLIMDTSYPHIAFVDISNLRNILHTSSMEKLIYCERGTCLRCMNGRDTTRSRQPDGPYEDIWGEDEIASLVHLPQPTEAERFATRHVRVLPFMKRMMYNSSS
ncbi:F-box/LRR-repeat protein At3g48880-like [Vigna radiata var. radiata]|uniref:F-box/LRR-repeat protein At3g48880-like n=1 Tax=Vigna radiata var. radiata TaxID=3916 RepID=A0A1S3T8Z9_VIGRR|nr:F-box/LRR-repeat protein At3g48880-like [Vigna radiata var. radiata]